MIPIAHPDCETSHCIDDPNDHYLIALALASPTNWFFTRDRHFDDVQIEGLTIVPPRRALQVVEGRA
jgi:hypothetical protein